MPGSRATVQKLQNPNRRLQGGSLRFRRRRRMKSRFRRREEFEFEANQASQYNVSEGQNNRMTE